MDAPVSVEVVIRALRKIVAGLQGLKRKPVAIGAIAYRTWGVAAVPQRIDLLIPAGEEHRAAILGAARGEGFRQREGLKLDYTDTKIGGSTTVDLVEASTPFLAKVHTRAQDAGVLEVQMHLAACEDLILMGCASDDAADRATIVELLRCTAGRMDAQYLKREAEAAGLFDKVKALWGQAKQAPG